MRQPLFIETKQRLLELERTRVELIVNALLGDELVVASALNDLSVIEYHDDVRVLDRGQTVSDYEYRSSLHELVHAALNDCLGTRID